MELFLVVDHACNLRCSYCYSGRKVSKAMSQKTAERAVDFALAKDSKTLRLSFFGGEPLLHMDLVEHATCYAERRIAELGLGTRFSAGLNTNAVLVDDRVVRFAKEHPTYAYVSLDGPKDVHDRHRRSVSGEGSYEAVRAGLLKLVEAGVSVGVVSVINPDTAGLARSIVEEMLSLPVTRATLACNLRAHWDDEAIESLRGGLLAAIEPWKQAFRSGRLFHLEPFTGKILTHLHAAMPCASRCQLGAEDLAVAPSGRFYPCGEVVGEDTDLSLCIGDLDAGIDAEKLARLRAQKDTIENHCESCEIRERCASACGCKHIALTGTYGRITDTLCNTEAAFIEAADLAAEALHAEQCSAFTEFFYRKRWLPSAANGLVRLRRKTEDQLT